MRNPLAKLTAKEEDERRSKERSHVPLVLLTIFAVGMVIVIAGGVLAPKFHVAVALLWGFGFCVSGMLMGFLFAIPRVLPAGAVAASTRSDTAGAARTTDSSPRSPGDAVGVARTPQSEINSNLVEVSDWLTKIIVGVGLVELKNLPDYAGNLAAFVAPGLGSTDGAGLQVAAGIVLFFSVLGFLIGYLLTRIYLAVIIKHADTQVVGQNVRLEESGKEVDLSELIWLQQTSLSDVQQTVAEIVESNPQATAKVEAPLPSTGRQKHILWVDDEPGNNTLLVEQLSTHNVRVEEALSTKDALAASERRKFDIAISDMSRIENGKTVRDAGVQLTRQLHERDPGLPVLILCARKGVEDFGEAARIAGARLVTSSGTRLIAEINRILRADAAAP